MLRYVVSIGTLQLDFAVALPKDFERFPPFEVLFPFCRDLLESIIPYKSRNSNCACSVCVAIFYSSAFSSGSESSHIAIVKIFSAESNLATYFFAG